MANGNYVVNGKSVWKSPNKMWSIEVPADGERYFLGYRLGHRVLQVAVSDGWLVYYAQVYDDGKIVEDEMFEYRVPKYVREKTYAILRKTYQNYKAGRKLY